MQSRSRPYRVLYWDWNCHPNTVEVNGIFVACDDFHSTNIFYISCIRVVTAVSTENSKPGNTNTTKGNHLFTFGLLYFIRTKINRGTLSTFTSSTLGLSHISFIQIWCVPTCEWHSWLITRNGLNNNPFVYLYSPQACWLSMPRRAFVYWGRL